MDKMEYHETLSRLGKIRLELGSIAENKELVATDFQEKIKEISLEVKEIVENLVRYSQEEMPK